MVSEADLAFCELGLALGLLCGPLEVSVIIATGIVLWGGYVVSKKFCGAGTAGALPQDRGRISEKGKDNDAKKDILEKRRISECFFVAAAAFFWLVVWPF